MINKDRIWNSHSLYNLSRYVFLRIENEYNSLIEPSGITLPQLRVLWIIKSFSGISLGEIAKIGCWAPPTVTKMLRILLSKGLVEKEQYHNKKLYRLQLTKLGEEYININIQGHDESFPLLKLRKQFNEEELDLIISLLKTICINKENEIILSYIDNINEKNLKIDYNGFSVSERMKLQRFVTFYNLLRTFILSVESEHRQHLVKYNLTYPQLRALWIIEAFPKLTSVQLSEISFWSPSTANVVVRNLYTKGLILKEKSSFKNSLYLYLSHEGEELIIDEFRENLKKLSIFNISDKIKSNELEKVIMLLRRMNAILMNNNTETYIERTFNIIQKRI